MENKTLLIFDHDGTLHDSMAIFGPGMHEGIAWLQQNGYPGLQDVSDERISRFLGLNSVDVWAELVEDFPEDMCRKVVRVVGDRMEEMVHAGKARWFDGITQQLDILKEKGYRMVILSNCEIQLARFYSENFKIATWFDKFYECESYGFRPKTEIILEILKDYPGYRAIMIGDRSNDFDCAKAADIPFIGCAYGFGTPEELDGADAIAQTPSALSSVIVSVDRL